jgi:hypothetical protein
MKILVKWPTRSRPERFAKALRMYQELRTTDDVSFLITIDGDDRTMNRKDILDSMKQWGNLRYDIINHAGKIGAINAGLAEISHHYDIIVLASDDMIPVGPGWDLRIQQDMAKYFPDTDGVLWYNDGAVGNKLNTLAILGTKYFRRFGYIYHPDYKALWCDNEFMEVAQTLGKQQYIDDVIIRHEHPVWGYGKSDALNQRDNRLYHDDQRTYERRKADHFGITHPVIEYYGSDHTQPEGDVQQADSGAKPANRKRGSRPVGSSSKPVRQPSAVDRGKKK